MIILTAGQALLGFLGLIFGVLFLGSLVLGILEDDYSGAFVFGFFLAVCVVFLVV